MELLLTNMRAAYPGVNGTVPIDIAIDKGRIVQVASGIKADAQRVIDGHGKLVVFPGLVDMHVHLRDPGFTHKEDILTGTEAAKAGGFTTIACMPNTNPPIDNPEVLSYVLNKAKSTGVKVMPVACITKGMKGEELIDFWQIKNGGAIAVSDDGRPVENAEMMRQAVIKAYQNNMPIISHCEDLRIINGGIINDGKVSAELGIKGMNRASEDYITAREITLAMSSNCAIHIAHVSTEGSVKIIRAAKKDGVKVTCETCPHYFTYTDEMVRTLDADYRMNPPLREERDRLAIERAVIDGTIDCIVTDHAPHTAQEKADFYKAPNGVVGLETSFAATLTRLYHTEKVGLDRIAELMSLSPRRILGMDMVTFSSGSVADLTIADVDYEWTVEPKKLHSKSKNSVFKGEFLKGKPVFTIADGKIIYEYQL